MTLIIPPGFCQASFDFDHGLGSKVATVTLGVTTAGSVEKANEMFDAWHDTILTHQASNCRLLKVRLKDGPNSTGAIFESSSPPAVGGDSGGAPPQVALLFKKQTAHGGRAGRGRMYVPGPPAEYLYADGGVNPALQTAAQTTADDFLEAMVTLTFIPVLLHSGSSDPDPILNLHVEDTVATQRRRVPGR